jgi:hypothetical protein
VATREEIRRIELAVGGPATGGAYAGCLGRPDYGALVQMPFGVTQVNRAAPNVAVATIQLAPMAGVPVTAIAIAPDSPIHAVDVYLGGFNTSARRHRVTPSAPLIGELSGYNLAAIVPVCTLFDLVNQGGDGSGGVRGAWGRQNFVWDTTLQDACVYPMRLDVCYGGARPTYTKRAPLKALISFSTRQGNGVSQANDKINLFALVDGRSSFDVEAFIDSNVSGGGPTGSPTLDVEVISPTLDSAGNVARYALSTDALTAGTPKVKSYSGNPATILRARVSGSECEGYLKIEAWD